MSLGTFRYILALIVLITHLWIGAPHGFAAYAVWGFFLLSGFLMTYILCVKYTFTPVGILNYLYNRALRIYPLYWISILIGIAAMYYLDKIGVNYYSLNPGFGMPISCYDWINNLFLLPDYYYNNPVPVANALRIEVLYYFLMLFFAYDKRIAWFGFGIGIVWNFCLLYDTFINKTDHFMERYASAGPCIIAFTFGSLLFHYKESLAVFSNKYLSLASWFLNGCVWYVIPNYPWNIGLYISLGTSAWVVLSLYKEKSTKADQFLGDLSYPIYLLHTTIGALCMSFFSGLRTFGFMLFSCILIHIVCILLIYMIDHPMRKLKR